MKRDLSCGKTNILILKKKKEEHTPQVQTSSDDPNISALDEEISIQTPDNNQEGFVFNGETSPGDPAIFYPRSYEDMPPNYQPPEPPGIYKPSLPPCMSGWVLR